MYNVIEIYDIIYTFYVLLARLFYCIVLESRYSASETVKQSLKHLLFQVEKMTLTQTLTFFSFTLIIVSYNNNNHNDPPKKKH